MAVSIDTVANTVKRTLEALHSLEGDELFREDAKAAASTLAKFDSGRQYLQPNADWLQCELCAALGKAAEVLKRAGNCTLAGQISNLVLADALYAIAAESHFAAFRHPTRTAEISRLSDVIRSAASRAGMLVTLEPPNCATRQEGHSRILRTLNAKLTEGTSQVGTLRKILITDPHCDPSPFGPVFQRVEQHLPG